MDEVKSTILYLSYDGMTDPLGQSQVLSYIIGLSKRGYRFHLISFEKPDRFDKLQYQIQKICNQNEIVWHPKIYTKKPPLFSTLYDVWRMRNLAFKLHKKHNFSIVHCRSYLSALVGMYMKNKFKIKFLFDMRGFWADERVEGKIWDLKSPLFKSVYNFFKRKEKEFFLTADHIISLTHNGKQEITSWKGFENLTNKIEVIPCCADLLKFNPDLITENQKNELRQKLKIDQAQFILGYIGSIGTWYMLDEMLKVFKSLQQKKENAIFLFVTGDNPIEILNKAQNNGISENSLRIQSAMHAEVATYISLFNVSVFFILPAYSKKASSPTKQGELMSMGIPIICNSGVGDTDKIIEKYKAGVVIQEMTEQNFSCLNWDIIPFKQALARKGAEEFYGLENGIEKYVSVYQKLLT